MNDFEQKMAKYWMDDVSSVRPFLGARFDYSTLSLSREHSDQIHYLNHEGTVFIRHWMYDTKMFSSMVHLGGMPFNEQYFNSIEHYHIPRNYDTPGEFEQIVKKWLFKREIPFAKYVFFNSVESKHVLMMTWKMVIKFWDKIFWAEDVIVVDSSLTWSLFFNHHDEFYFGSDVIIDKEEQYKKTIELNNVVKEWNAKLKPPS